MSTITKRQGAGETPQPEDWLRLVRMIHGYRVTQMLAVAAKLGIADFLADGPKSVAELAERTETHPGALHRLLRALAGNGVLAEDDRGRFALTPLGGLLRTDDPGSARALAIYNGDELVWRSWGSLLHSVATGSAAFQRLYGMSIWEYRSQHPEPDAVFNDAMTALSNRRIGDVMATYDFSGIRTIVDVGGGHGALLAAILRAHPGMRGILFDQPHVAAGAHRLLETAGVADRCRIVAGDFFEEVPTGGDAYILSKIIHDWGDERATAILRACRRAMTAQARLLLAEAVIPAGNGPHVGKLLDLHMLVMLEGGCERTEGEFRTLLAGAGFSLTRVLPANEENSVIEARPV